MRNLNEKFQNFIPVVLLLTILHKTVSEESWKWGSNSRRNENARSIDDRNPVIFKKQFDYIDSRPLPQYEVSESVEGIAGRPLQKPPDFRPPSDYDARPSNLYPNNRPGGFGQVGQNYPQGIPKPSFWGDEHPGGLNENNEGVLTGPVPSWVREPAIKNYDRCKCSLKMNCNSPGISFGQCDAGKQYCCYNSNGNGLDGTNPRPQHHSSDQGILVGPGGPTGHIGRPGSPRPVVDRPYDYANGHPGILVGPGGPTGVIGRPPGQVGRPQNIARPPNTRYPSESNGILVGPGGPFDYPQRPYGSYQQRPYSRS